mgnify:CR=1 FL=1
MQPEQWRKHTGGLSPRGISVTRPFFMAALQVLSDEEIKHIVPYMASLARTGTWMRNHRQGPSRVTVSATKPLQFPGFRTGSA